MTLESDRKVAFAVPHIPAADGADESGAVSALPAYGARQRKEENPLTMPSRKKQREHVLGGKPSGLEVWLPIMAGVALGCVAPRLKSMLVPLAPWIMRTVFPYVELSGRREFGISEELSRQLPQLMLYLQFPLEGLLTCGLLRRGGGKIKAFGQIIFLHAAGVLALWLLSQPLGPGAN